MIYEVHSAYYQTFLTVSGKSANRSSGLDKKTWDAIRSEVEMQVG
ncbi:hypothetical protein GAYE_SCF41G5513 [Galdieria yellowstonensis]|uniref:Uncharacterized protein n=1 Tax=Galdieria yellowstonensis TaxID=3028027 RepID=A0AAV9IJD2_9RHOD|nr:hypothetical protein GAYE_SCF41G5513 [Galdieria yellowstonensis]